MITDLSDITRVAISLLPIIVILIVFRWIIKMWSNWDSVWGSSSISFDGQRKYEPKGTLIDEVKVICDNCGATNREQGAVCEFCDSKMYKESKSENEVDAVCDGCGASNEDQDAFCGHCGSAMYTNGTIKVKPMRVKAREVEE